MEHTPRHADVDFLENPSDRSDRESEPPTAAETAGYQTGSTGASATPSSASYVASSVPSNPDTTDIFYTDEHKLAIFNLCYLWQGEYTLESSAQFFQNITDLFNEDHNMHSPTVRPLIINMLKKRRDETEGWGWVIPDTDLEHVMDGFLIRFDTMNAEAATLKPSKLRMTNGKSAWKGWAWPCP
ncbi:hypothetical protein POJ06DRAFT_300795 [Lipomyces tetrasporus]|uniref:Uncharacterized protein n=1 Tax=Lipomyces tetrasporus TaxID=54092 RepID=A0AAD7QX59_9ASCO|nr:uncharacterized protein POJ06DRAFT_300795 [Lipomyces tetrasporus]KAJ8101477.1 hypothetical protein POJ06DRAFT_300795 [Lipomyces tetrasporus]